jgi:hypothetical protein
MFAPLLSARMKTLEPLGATDVVGLRTSQSTAACQGARQLCRKRGFACTFSWRF